jgi:hypothetical protein
MLLTELQTTIRTLVLGAVAAIATVAFSISAALVLIALSSPGRADDCHPETTARKPQFVVGYGSLMERGSKDLSAPTAGPNHPVKVTGFRRAWNTHGAYGTTFLGVTEAEGAAMVAVIYADPDGADIAGTDRREQSYCRQPVDADSVELLDGWRLPADAEIWIYVNKSDHVGRPDKGKPIVQSYVDIFLTGCLQMQDGILPEVAARMDFPAECIRTTSGWSEYWVNDRIYPRRPFIYQRNAATIDQLLSKELPDLFEKIEIE